MIKLCDGRNKKAFTLVEVILVLAIAGLILLMVFLVIPAARRSVRNNQRKEAMAQMIRAIDQFTEDNNGLSPIADMSTSEMVQNFTYIVSEYLGVDCYLQNSSPVAKTSSNGINNYQFRILSPQGDLVCNDFTDPDGRGYGIDIRTRGPANEELMHFTVELDEGSKDNHYTDQYYDTYKIGSATGTNYDIRDKWHNYMVIFPEAYCSGKNGEGYVKQANDQPTYVAIAYILEGGAVACVDNSSSH